MNEKQKKRLEDESIVTEQDKRNKRMIEAQVHKETDSVVTRMDKMLDRLDVALPFLEQCGRRHDNHTIWLAGLSAVVFVVGLIVFMTL